MWISVEEKLPKKNVGVLVKHDYKNEPEVYDTGYAIAYYNGYEWSAVLDMLDESVVCITLFSQPTHWMEIPQ